MNQEQNNFNQNSFNMEGNNGIPNNEPLNNFNQNPSVNQPVVDNQGLQYDPSFNNTFNQGTQQDTNINQPMYNSQPASSFQQPINQMKVQEPIPQIQPQSFNTYQQPIETQHPNKKINIKLLIIIIAVIVVIVIGIIFILNLLGNKGESSNSSIEVSSTFEQKDGHYVLQDEQGNILLDNIRSHGEFCNGTTQVRNLDGEYGIIDVTGKFIAEYGKYDDVEQYDLWGDYYCFYEVTDKTNDYKKQILKYDGSILYSNEDDKFLRNAQISLYEDIDQVLFTTKDKYQILNKFGNAFLTFERTSGAEEPKLRNKGIWTSSSYYPDEYISIYYNGKSYIYNLTTFKPVFDFEFNGDYWMEFIEYKQDLFGNDQIERYIVLGYPNPDDKQTSKAFVIHNGKIQFDLNNCFRATITDNQISCLKNSKSHHKDDAIYEYYDLNGNKITQ